MQVRVKFLRQSGRATCSIDASELHDYLRALGVPLTPDGTQFADQPSAEYGEIDTYRNRLSTKLLLKLGPQTVNLGDHYRQPIGADTLNTLSDTVGEVVRAVVDHYRPIEISVVISGKSLANPTGKATQTSRGAATGTNRARGPTARGTIRRIGRRNVPRS